MVTSTSALKWFFVVALLYGFCAPDPLDDLNINFNIKENKPKPDSTTTKPPKGPCNGTSTDWDCCASSSPCYEGQGDCDGDDGCAGSLICGKDNCKDSHPQAEGAADCCIKLKAGPCNGTSSDWDCCASSSPCYEGQGDCDGDEGCAGSLICGKDNCKDFNPQAEGAADCCIKELSCPSLHTNTWYRRDQEVLKNINSAWQCSIKCREKTTCNFWSWASKEAGKWALDCVLMSGYGQTVSDKHVISGARACNPIVTFSMMGYGEFCSGSSIRITDEETCKHASNALGLDWGNSWNGSGDFPGCIHTKDDRNKVYFNTSPNPSNDSHSFHKFENYAEICTTYIGDIRTPRNGLQERTNNMNGQPEPPCHPPYCHPEPPCYPPYCHPEPPCYPPHCYPNLHGNPRIAHGGNNGYNYEEE